MTKPKIGSLCSGMGAMDLAAADLFPDTDLAWCSEIDPAASRVLAARFPHVPNIGDLRAVTPEPVDILHAGFPCQPVSTAGRREGVNDERWLFDDIVAFIGRMDPPPRLLLFENVPGLLTANGGAAMGRVVEGLAGAGYVGRYRVLAASDVGACHRRQRVFIAAAHTDSQRRRQDTGSAHGDESGNGRRATVPDHEPLRAGPGRVPPTRTLIPTPRTADGMANPLRDPSAIRTRRSGDPFGRLEDTVALLQNWGEYAAAVAVHEQVVGRPAPEPAVGGRLNARFVEWMMMLPEGWVTDVGLSNRQTMRVLGNGVVPAQAVAAFRLLVEGKAKLGETMPPQPARR